MKRITVFLLLLITLFSALSLGVHAEEASVAPKKTPVEILLEQSVSSTEKNGILLVGGSASYAWSKTFAFDMYPRVCASLVVDGSLSDDWLPYVPMLTAYQPKALVVCLDGRDDPVTANNFVRTLVTTFPNAKVYAVSAFAGENFDDVNRTVLAVVGAKFIDGYTAFLKEDGTVDSSLVGEMGLTEKGLRALGEYALSIIGADFSAAYPTAPEYIPPALEPDVPVEESSSYRWLVPVVILAAGLIIGLDCARTAAVNDRRRKANSHK